MVRTEENAAAVKPAFLIFLSSYATWAASTKVALDPSAATYISSKEPDRNFAASGKLEISPATAVLLRYDISSIPASAVVASVQFNLVLDPPQTAPPTVCDLSKDFVESEATYKFAAKNIPWSAPGLQRFSDYGSGSLVYCSDIANFIRMAINTHRKSVSFVVLPAPQTASLKRPKLELNFDPAVPKAVANHPFPETKFGAVNLDASASTKPDGTNKGLEYLWTVENPAPASTYSSGQELGRAVNLKFEPDVPGLWNLRLTVVDRAANAASATIVPFTDLNLAPHPRLGLNLLLINSLKALRASKSPIWTRFEEWLKNPTQRASGSIAEGLLLGYAVTGNQGYFTSAWKISLPTVYANGKDRANGFPPPESASARAILQVALLYDWGFDALTAGQRHDLIDWLNAANSDAFHRQSATDTGIALGLAASVYATYEENRLASIQMGWFRREWEQALKDPTPSLIPIANLVYYASGENLFESDPYFRRQLAAAAFSAEPGLRPNGLALARRFPNSEEAALFNWVFRQKENDRSADPAVDLLYYSPAPALAKPKRLSYFDASTNSIYIRSDWNGTDGTSIFWTPAKGRIVRRGVSADLPAGGTKVTSFAANAQAVAWIADDAHKYIYLRERDQFVEGPAATAAIAGMDLRAPVLSSAKPSGQLLAGTKLTAISVVTDKPSACRFSFRPDVSFSYMTNELLSTDGRVHTTVNRELNNGDTYTYYVRCSDQSGNENQDDLRITFSVAH